MLKQPEREHCLHGWRDDGTTAGRFGVSLIVRNESRPDMGSLFKSRFGAMRCRPPHWRTFRVFEVPPKFQISLFNTLPVDGSGFILCQIPTGSHSATTSPTNRTPIESQTLCLYNEMDS